ncbi:hypothetical protein HRbin36_00945 [bacterium HR36]|nr:hypothetical protein HRbin36_00945 [bacterium HR36]
MHIPEQGDRATPLLDSAHPHGPGSPGSTPLTNAVMPALPTDALSGPLWLAPEMTAKIPSTHAEIWLRLLPTPKLIDRLRCDWDFRGLLVKFKLEAGISEAVLLERAEESRRRSAADLMVANLLETVSTTAWLGPINGQYHKLPRHQLPSALLDALEAMLLYSD